MVPSLQEVPPELVAAAPPADGAGAAGAAGTGDVAVLDGEDFCLPPWPLQAPRPVAADVVPSLQVVVAWVSSAWLGTVNTNSSSGAARAPMRFLLFTAITPIWLNSSPTDCKPNCAQSQSRASGSRFEWQQSGYIDEKPRVFVPRGCFEHGAIHADPRVLDDGLRKLGHADELQVGGRQALVAMCRCVHVRRSIQCQYRYMVDAIGGWKLAEMNAPGHGVLDGFLQQTTDAMHATR